MSHLMCESESPAADGLMLTLCVIKEDYELPSGFVVGDLTPENVSLLSVTINQHLFNP